MIQESGDFKYDENLEDFYDTVRFGHRGRGRKIPASGNPNPTGPGKKVILIGNHKQLPPVINPVLFDPEKIDLEEREISVNQPFHHSFFERIYNSEPDGCKTMLDVQFRMAAVIGTAISQLFYNGKLESGAGTAISWRMGMSRFLPPKS